MRNRTKNSLKVSDLFALGLVVLYDFLPILGLIGLMALPEIIF